MKFVRRIQHLRKSKSGASALEFAFVLPPMLLMLVGFFETGFALFVHGSLENAMLSASRYGITGAGDPGLTREQKVEKIVQDNTFGTVDMEKVAITTKVYESFSDIGKPEPFADSNENGTCDGGEAFTDVNGNTNWDADMGAAGLGGSGDIVLYEVKYSLHSMTGLLDPIFGLINYRVALAVRNEPYPGDTELSPTAGTC